MKIILNLTEAQAELLEDIISSHWDEGPCGEGWQSPELKELSDIINKEIEDMRGN